MNRWLGVVAVVLALSGPRPVLADADGPAADCVLPVDIDAYADGKFRAWNWDEDKLDLKGLAKVLNTGDTPPKRRLTCLRLVDLGGNADRERIAQFLLANVKPRGAHELTVQWRERKPPAPPPQEVLPEDPTQYLPLTLDEYKQLDAETTLLSRCSWNYVSGRAAPVPYGTTAQQVDGRKIAKKVVAAGLAPDLLRDAATLPDYLTPEATVPSSDKGELIDQTSAALWGVTYYQLGPRLGQPRTMTELLRARALFAYYVARAAKLDCQPSETFTRLFSKANAR